MRGPYTGLPGLEGKFRRPANAPGERHTELKVARKMQISHHCKMCGVCLSNTFLMLQTNLRIRPIAESETNYEVTIGTIVVKLPALLPSF
jgi:hypothetical protein